jgi:heme-degrading monooxygenase HmoA
MAFVFGHFEVGDYDAWKQMFDSDPAGRAQSGKGHRVYRSVDNPNAVFVAVEFNSAEDAKAFRERLLASGALANLTVKTEPTVVEEADSVEY